MGPGALIAAVVLAVASALASTRSPRVGRLLLLTAATALWLAALRVIVAMIQTDVAFVYVADHSRRGASLFHRISGLWAGSEGSLLLFAAVTASVLALVREPLIRHARPVSAVVVAGLTGAVLFAASPFERLDLPPLDGRGMTPILEHPAMIIHPPLLYLGTILSLVPVLVVEPRRRRHFAATAFGILTVALALGAMWAYGELGWGGWWAWDPVENVALIPWLLLAASFHAPPASRQAQLTLGAIWPLVFAGAAMTRTSLRTSVHAFANATGLGWWLWPIVGIAALLTGVVAYRARDTRPARRSTRSLARWLLVSSAVVVALGTFRPFLPGDGTEGWFYARMLYPAAVAGVVALGVAPRWSRVSRARLGAEVAVGSVLGLVGGVLLDATEWFQLLLAAGMGAGIVTLLGDRVRHLPRWFAHGGMLLILLGVLGGTASTQRTLRVEQGMSVSVAGHTVTNQGVTVSSEPHLLGTDVDRIEAALLIDDRHLLTPSIGVYPERALRLAEASTRTRPLKDIQLILRSADDAGTVVVTVNVRPLNQLVWWGAAFLTAGSLAMTLRRRPPGEASALL